MRFFLLFLNAVAASVTSCGGLFKINQLILTPSDQARAGDNVTLTLLYDSPVIIEKGMVTTAITYSFIPISPTKSPLCDVAPCPITVGSHDGSSWSVIPFGVNGKVMTTVTWRDDADIVLLCIKMTLAVSVF